MEFVRIFFLTFLKDIYHKSFCNLNFKKIIEYEMTKFENISGI